MRELIHTLQLRLKALLHRGQLEKDLDDELAYHLELRRANGGASTPFGSVTSIREQSRDLWTFDRLENAGREVRQAVRTLRRTPGHTLAIMVLLALGIGANAAMFSLANALYFRELPVKQPEQLVTINPGWATQSFDDFRRVQQSFSGIFATGSLLGVTVASESGEQLPASGALVSGNYFDVLGVKPAFGRLFDEADDTVANPRPIMVIGASLWRRQFNASPDVIGSKILLSGSPFTIVGVAAEGYTGEQPGRIRDFWAPLNMQPVAKPEGDLRRNRGFRWLTAMGRLKPGVTIAQAQAEGQAVRESLFGSSRTRLELEPAANGSGGLRRTVGPQLRILAAAVAIVLLIVWTNVATLLLARGAARQRELAVRRALGAGRLRLFRQLLLEGILLATAGGLIGLALAPASARALLLLRPSFDVVQLDLSPDWRILAFGTSLSLLTAIVFSFAPALRASRAELRGRSGASSKQRTIRSLIALQAAFSVMLVALSLLFARSLFKLHSVDGGYDRRHIITTTVNLPLAGYRDSASEALLARRLVDGLTALPGVRSASVGLCAVLMGCSRMGAVTTSTAESSVWINPVTQNYFETAGIPIVQGRGFGAQDHRGATRVAVVTSALARTLFSGQPAVGQRFSEGGVSVEVIGVTRDVTWVSPRDAPIRMAFYSLDQVPGSFSYIQVRTWGSPAPLVPAVRQAILAADRNLFLIGPEPLSYTLDLILARETLLSRATSLFGLIALMLACFGVYGVISYLVVSRTAELGIRLAIGAKPHQIMREVIGGALGTVAPGLIAGLAAAWASGRLIESQLFGVSSQDPLLLAAVSTALLLTTGLASALPALRASRIDPLKALRFD